MSSGGGTLQDHLPLVFRLNENGLGPDVLRQVFLERGWNEFDEDSQSEYDWNIWWRTSRFRTSDYDSVFPWQRLNHYPRSTVITRKDALARNLKRMRCVHGASIYNFSPLSFNLPNDYTKFVKTYEAMRSKQGTEVGKSPLWICKPADLSRGRGIFLFRDLGELMYDCNAVVQQYVENPILIGGYKFDLRIYVAVMSFHPLQVYIHEEGLVRFGTEKFDLASTKNIFAHLTNTSINKYSPGYTEDKERVGPGCKWTLTQLRRYFAGNNVNDQALWPRIVSIVILTLLLQAPQVQKVDNCFELYGFDVLVDENIKPWLLEVNFSPSLSVDCQSDVLAKKPMLHDLMDLLHFEAKDVDRGGPEFRQFCRTYGTSSPGALGARRNLARGERRRRSNSRKRMQGSRMSSTSGGGGAGIPESDVDDSGSVVTTKKVVSNSNLSNHNESFGLPLAGNLDTSLEEEDREPRIEKDEEVAAAYLSDSNNNLVGRYRQLDREAQRLSQKKGDGENGKGNSSSSTLQVPTNLPENAKTTISTDSHESTESKTSGDSGVGSLTADSSSSNRTHSNHWSDNKSMRPGSHSPSGRKGRTKQAQQRQDVSKEITHLLVYPQNKPPSARLSRKGSGRQPRSANAQRNDSVNSRKNSVSSPQRKDSVKSPQRRDSVSSNKLQSEASFHLPSLQNSASNRNRMSNKTLRSSSIDPYPSNPNSRSESIQQHRNNENFSRNENGPRSDSTVLRKNASYPERTASYPERLGSDSRSKSTSMKSLPALDMSRGRNNSFPSQRPKESRRAEAKQTEEDDEYPLTHRSAVSLSGASVVSGSVAGTRRGGGQRRNLSSMSTSRHRLPPNPYKGPPFPQPGGHHRTVQQQFSQFHRANSGHQRLSFSSLRKRVGDFHLVFPFNETTYKCAAANLDAKTVIRETQQKLKELLSAVASRAKSAGKVRSSFVDSGDACLWGPVKVIEEDM